MEITLDYLIPQLRFKIGDGTAPYRYTDDWLTTALNLAMRKFQRYNKSKYLIAPGDLISRNSTSKMFETYESEVGVIEPRDEYLLVLLAAYAVLEGSLESSAWNTVSWKDAEISYSNLESGRIKEGNLKRLAEEINNLVLSPTKRLASTDKQSLPGFLNNDFERSGDL